MTDDRLFVSSYANTDQARDAVVFEFEGPNNEIYQAYKRYFNFLWHHRSTVGGAVKEDEAKDGKYDSFELSSGAVVYCNIGGEKRVLLLERLKRYGGSITLPKGHIIKREYSNQTALREVHEETGLPLSSIKIVKDLGWYTNPIVLENGARVLKIVHYFLVRYKGKTLPTLKSDPEHKSANWHSIKEMSNLKFAYSHIKHVIDNALSHLE
jgi:8-oxo-dGTP pyrophosphatase MutT (NUDIX family)